MDTHPLLIDESPLLLRPTLACVLAHAGLTPGDRQALWTQQLHYWIQVHRKAGHSKTHHHHDRWWVWNSIERWQAQFPFWSQGTIKRVISRSVQAGVTLSANYNRAKYDRTLWYTIDYDRLEGMAQVWERSRPSDQNDPMDWVSLAQSTGSDCDNGEDQSDPLDRPNLPQPIPETSKDFPEMERQRAWSTACRELALQMTPSTFAMWIAGLRLERVSGEQDARKALIRCPTGYVREWCQYRLDVQIRRVLAGVLGVALDSLAIEYVVSQ